MLTSHPFNHGDMYNMYWAVIGHYTQYQPHLSTWQARSHMTGARRYIHTCTIPLHQSAVSIRVTWGARGVVSGLINIFRLPYWVLRCPVNLSHVFQSCSGKGQVREVTCWILGHVNSSRDRHLSNHRLLYCILELSDNNFCTVPLLSGRVTFWLDAKCDVSVTSSRFLSHCFTVTCTLVLLLCLLLLLTSEESVLTQHYCSLVCNI